MRAFGYVTAVVLIVIGIAVGALAATNCAGLDNVSGRFVMMGGSYPGLAVPLTGKVIITSTTGITYTTTAASNGRWAVDVPPGSYGVTGIARRGWHCHEGNHVKVSAGVSVSKVVIVCPVV